MDVAKLVLRIATLSYPTQYLIALLAGLCLPLAFAPMHLIPFLFISPAILFLLWLDKTPRIAFRIGYAFGFGFFSFGISWAYIAIHVYGGTAAWLAIIMTGLFAAFLALFVAMPGWLAAIIVRRFRLARILQLTLLFPVLWFLFEWTRGWIFTGMPWLSLGYAISFPAFSGFAPILGVYGLSFFVILITGLIIVFFDSTVRVVRSSILIIISVIVVTSYGLTKIEWTQPDGKQFTVSLVQGNAEQITKWDANKVQLRMDTYAKLSRQHWDSDAIVWPENAMTIFYHQLDKQYLLPLAKEAKSTDTDLIVGLPFMDQAYDRYYSSMMTFSAEDKDFNGYSGVFHKVHLVPFGEFIPFADFLRGLVNFFDLPMSSFSAGQPGQALLKIRGEPVATSICYEDSFGDELIRQLPEATLLMNGSNNAWYGDSLAPHQHLQIARMRAIETGRMLIRATTNGISAFVDHKGQIVARAPQFEVYVLTHTVQPRTGATPYVKWGNTPIVMFNFILLLGLLIYSKYLKKT